MSGISRLLEATTVLLAAGAAVANPIEARGTINHDAVVGFSQTVPGGVTGSVYLAYQPLLKVVNGCVPFPAVDASGNTGGGLQDTGASEGHCSKSTGQIYVRKGELNGKTALMYSWYFPKDEPSDGIGHRHDWEGTIVWLKSGTSTAANNIAAVCPSAHGGWKCATSGYNLQGSKPLIKYESAWPLDHSCGLTNVVGGSQPLIAWESLPNVARVALTNTDFGKANVPFKDANFNSNLAKATF
ncbi:necrosis and ethylene inducing peptide 2 precursor [Grosmannia clavigera kw1407]|uniref:Necrosis and ethylene inducing peptide 2 n=1 Tax=Grosmannia clavigera (strain kw1407 / UAMH 11150) TaxID=655863 RepID=F0XL88_GROCL|nr:necrosis and ethylene inducing peptide 2 precursor [Grosmannia clavigera kw1407]EFX01241.1 necrosis and ethylene inducing peptide 2 precursor [Grosmannia clavigera kw1407]